MSGDGGSAAPVLLGVVGVVIVLAVAVADVGLVLAGRHQAALAADAAALAAAPVTFRAFGAVGSPRQEAARFAALNGTTLTACSCAIDRSWRARTVEVVVERRVELIVAGSITVRAKSAAEFDPVAAVLAS